MNFIHSKVHGKDFSAGLFYGRRRARRLFLGAIAPIAAALAPTAWAARAGAAVHLTSVESGSASVSQSGSTTTIKTSNNAILNFSQFNIAHGSTVNFVQPTAASRELDRINSATPSTIQGSLISNGSVYLINPAGVIFGAGAMVDVNRIYVAGSHMSSQDFLSGTDHFSGISGMVSNSGRIHANQVYLVGSEVINQGSIVSPGGVVAMLSGSDVVITEPGSHVVATVTPAISASSATASGKQTDLRVSPLAAGDAYSLAIRHTGSIQAANVTINGGGGEVQISGSINASSQVNGGLGGVVSITGSEVDLASANIDASGPGGGGQVYIGGEKHGGGDLTHATDVTFDSSSVINADSTGSGAGGTIVLWADSSVTSAGTLSARGGPVAGNGGYIETSAPSLSVTSAVSASAPHGVAGSWELDPATVTIVVSGGDGVNSFNASDLSASLMAGTSVTLTATGALTQVAGALISATPATADSLVLQAGGLMELSGGITGTGGQALSVELDQSGGAAQPVDIDTAPININGTFNIVGGAVMIANASPITAFTVTMGTGTPVGGGTNVGGAIQINGTITSTGAFSATATTFATNTGAVITTNGGDVTLNASSSIVLTGAVHTGGGAFTATATSFTNYNTITNDSSGTPGFQVNAIVAGGGPIDIAGPVTFTGPVTLYTSGVGSNVIVNLPVTTSSVFTSGGGNFSLPAPASSTTVMINAASAAINNAANTIINTATVTLNIGTVSIAGPILTTTGGLLAGGTTSFISNQFGTITTHGDVDIINSGEIIIGEPVVTNGGAFTATLCSSFSSSGSGTITTTGGNVTLTTSGASGISIANEINTGGGGFTAVGQVFTDSATITDGGVTTGTGSFSVDTTSGANQAITISQPLSWASHANENVTLQGAGSITIASTGGITATGTVSLISTQASGGAITVTGAVSTTGPFIADGGNFTISPPAATTGGAPEPVILTAASAEINTSTVVLSTSTITVGTVSISGPVVLNGGNFDAGGTISFISNQFGSITTNGGSVNITNPGLIAVGQPVVTNGGSFTSTLGNSFGNATAGTITTSGGNVTLAASTSDEISIGQPVNTGGGSFTATAMGLEDTALISDGGVATANGKLVIDCTSGLNGSTPNNGATPITNLNISWTGGAGRSVLIEANAAISFNSLISTGTTPLPVTVYTASTSTADSITLNGQVFITGDFVASGSAFVIASGGSLNATTVSINNVSSFTSGTQTFSTTVGSVSLSGPVTSSGTMILAGTSVSLTSSGSLVTNGAALDLSSAGAVLLEGPITTEGGLVSVASGSTLTTDSSGTINSAGGNVSLEGASDVSIGAAVNTGGGNFTGVGSTFSNSAEISDGGVNDSQAQGLTITATSGNISIGGDISWAASFSPVTLSVPIGSVIELGADLTANSAEPIDLSNSTIELTGQGPIIAGGDVTLGPITGATAGSNALEIQAAGNVSLQAVGTQALPVGEFVVTNNGSAALPVTTLNGNIFTGGSIDFAGKVILPINIQIDDNDSNAGDTGIIEFDGPLEGPGGLTALLPRGGNYGQIRFNADVGDVTPVRFMNLFPGSGALVGFQWGKNTDPPAYPNQQPATVVNIASGGALEINNENPPVRDLTAISLFSTIDSYGPLTINIGSPDDPDSHNLYAVGQNERLSVFGSVSINVYGGTITTEDISSIGNMTLDASNIRFLLRGPTISNNTVVDSGIDLITSGRLTMPSNATYTAVSGTKVPGSFDVPGFVAQSYASSTNIGRVASELNTAFSYVPVISGSVLFASNGLLFDLTPNTLTTSIPTFVPPTPFVFDYPIAGAGPREQLVAGTVPLVFKVAFPPAVPGPIDQEDLKDTGLYTHDPSLEEIMGGVGTMAVYNDMPDHPRPRATDYQVVVNRLDPKRVAIFLKHYKQTFGDDPAARKSQMASDIQSAWDAYVSQSGGGNVSGAGFAAYCAGTPSAGAANQDLAQLHDLRAQVGMLGLSYKEAQVAFQYNMLGGLKAIGMREGDLSSAVANTAAPQ